MTRSTSTLLAATAIALSSVVAPAPASAAPDDTGSGEVQMPLSSKWRACDHTLVHFVDATSGDARPFAQVSSANGTVTAKVAVGTAMPDMRYDVRVIQTPRPSIGCGPGAPGVIAGFLQTDGAGMGGVTLQGPIADGATGAWVIIERPAAHSQTPAEFYTTSFVADI